MSDDLIQITSSFTGDTWTGEVDLAAHDSMPNDPTTEQKLERAFRFFNRVTEADERRLEEIGYRLPSMSAGDRVILNGEIWWCAAIGFKRDADRDPSERFAPWPLSGS